MSKSIVELAKDLGIALVSQKRLEKVVKLPWAEQPKELIRIIWSGLSLSKRKSILNQFGAYIEVRDEACSSPWLEAEGSLYNSPEYSCEWRTLYAGIFSEDKLPITDWFESEEDALDDLLEILLAEYSTALFLKLFKNPTMTVSPALYEVF